MKTKSTWTEKMKFDAESRNFKIQMDAKSPMGSDSAMTPKELLLLAVSGCTGMDVVALLKKFKQPFEAFSVDAEGELTEGTHPSIFKEIHLTFKITGNVEALKAIEAVQLSQTKYCGVSAMVVKSVPIHYTLLINEKKVGSGQAKFF
jgi:putative redox protein